ncbi:MAG: trypsin-like peptidase domain-containing protein [Blastocatellia bacterium]
MKRGLHYLLLTAILVSTLTVLLVVTALLRPRLLSGWVASLARSVRTVPATGLNAEVVDRARPGVVIVVARRAARHDAALRDNNGVSEENYEPQQDTPDTNGQPQRGTGTGFIIDPAGFIVTNNHVIRDADRIRVKLADGRERLATLQGSDTETDLALLKIDADNLTPLTIGDSDALRVGDPVIAIGNPLDYEYSVTAGIVSAKGRKVYNNAPYEEFIQTDAAINRGNSGGPLLNLAGEVIGVNTVIRVDGRGISFAVPGNVVKRVVTQLRAQGFVARGFLGLQPQNLTPEFREGLGLDQHLHGVLVVEVTADKPAARAGVRAYDVITSFDGKPIRTQDDFFSFVAATAPQRDVELEVVRGKEMLKLTATLDQRPDDPDGVPPAKASPLQQTSLRPGFSVRDNTPETQRLLKVGDGNSSDLPAGVIISTVDPLSTAEDAGLQVGQIIVEASRQPVTATTDFQRIIDPLKPGSVLVLRVFSPAQKVTRLVAVRME